MYCNNILHIPNGGVRDFGYGRPLAGVAAGEAEMATSAEGSVA